MLHIQPGSGNNLPAAVSSAAVRALLYEVSVTPKPGLVDRRNNGAHRDMDYYTFLDSALALQPYFETVTLCGYHFAGSAEQLLPQLRAPGLQAEKDMLAATGGINTHKGAIFSLGILCGGLGWLYRKGGTATAATLLDTAARICTGLCDELHHPQVQATNGQRAFHQHCVTGIRGEMEAGLPHIRHHAYPVLRQLAGQGHSLNDAGVVALLHLMAHVDDTNVINRGGIRALRQLQKQVAGQLPACLPSCQPPGSLPFIHLSSAGKTAEAPVPALKQPSFTTDMASLLDFASRLDTQLIEQNLSPGGCADLLALAFFLYFWFDAPALPPYQSGCQPLPKT